MDAANETAATAVSTAVSTAPTPTWAIMPVLECYDYTEQAVGDLLRQSVPMRVLIIDQGSSKATNDQLRELAERHHPQVLLWSFNPALPSLSAAWNKGLDFCWELGADAVLVVNNDVRLHRLTVEILRMNLLNSGALFVSAVGVRERQYEDWADSDSDLFKQSPTVWIPPTDRGGPDFSCFLLSYAGHQKYRFDEGFIPAYNEDLDMHRRYMLGGDGDKIFSINLPFLHFASRTINVMSPEQRANWEKRRNISRDYYLRKWGGGANAETFWAPFNKSDEHGPFLHVISEFTGPTTPELQAYWRIKPMGATLLPLAAVGVTPKADQ